MTHSMTGFARRELTAVWGTAVWELRSVNSRYLDCSPRLPEELRALEPQVRERLTARLSRGKVDCTLRYDPALGNEATVALDLALAAQLVRACRRIEAVTQEAGKDAAPIPPVEILRWPGVFRIRPPDVAVVGEAVIALLEEAIDELRAGRAREGRRIGQTIADRCDGVASIVEQIRLRLPEILAGVHERLATRLGEMREQLDPARLEQEMALLVQKTDVAEEMDRLAVHVDEVRRVLAEEEPAGRRLDFLMQEMNREANTLGSKSADVETTRASVDLKVLIEQMREQVQNLE